MIKPYKVSKKYVSSDFFYYAICASWSGFLIKSYGSDSKIENAILVS